MFLIKGKVALVTGGASGIGLMYAKELLKNGLKGVTLADVNEEFGKKATADITNEFGNNKVIFVKTDVSNKTEFESAFKTTVNAFKHVDILINNAGILNDSIWEKQMLININGTAHGILLAFENYLQKYRSSSEGVVVNVSSIAGLDPFPTIPLYTASKHAIIGLSRSFGAEVHYNRTKIRVLTMCPGATDTPLMDFNGPEKTLGPEYSSLIDTVNLHEMSQSPEFVAKAMVQIIQNGSNGSIWVAENKQAPYEIHIPPREERQKK